MGKKYYRAWLFVQILTVKYRFSLYVFMKVEIKAASAFYFNYPTKGICQWCFQLELSFKLLVK